MGFSTLCFMSHSDWHAKWTYLLVMMLFGTVFSLNIYLFVRQQRPQEKTSPFKLILQALLVSYLIMFAIWLLAISGLGCVRGYS